MTPTSLLAKFLALQLFAIAANSQISPVIEDKGILTESELKNVDPTKATGPDYRLPTNFVPTAYFVYLRPILDKDYPDLGKKNTAPGNVTIQMTCVEDTNKVVLHSKFLEIDESSILVGKN